MKRVSIAISFALAIAQVLRVVTACVADIDPKVMNRIERALPVSGFEAPSDPHRVLIFTKTNGFRHASIPVGVVALTRLGSTTGIYEVVHSEDDVMFEPETLNTFDAVIMLNTTGEVFRPKSLPDDPQERDAALQRENRLKKSLVDYVKSGKGLVGVHSATDTYKNWKAYNEMMGGVCVGHPWHTEVPIRLLDASHPLNAVFGGRGFMIKDEIYQFRDGTARPQDRRMLLSLNPGWEPISKGTREDGFYPLSWIAPYGNGRTFYCALGHRDETYSNPAVLRHYLAGIQYTLGDLAVDDAPIVIDEQGGKQ